MLKGVPHHLRERTERNKHDQSET